MWLFIQPNDTLFFRDGRPFNAGADVWTGIVFPPYPSTIYGMIRTMLVHLVSGVVDYNNFFSKVPPEFRGLYLGNNLDDKENPCTLSMRGPFLARRGDKQRLTLWIQSPRDLWKKEDEDAEIEYYMLQPVHGESRQENLAACSDLNIPFHLLRFGGIDDIFNLDEAVDAIGWHDLNHYLSGELRNGQIEITEEKFWQEEPSTIIEREKNLTAKEHQLAHPIHTRMQCEPRFEENGFLVYLDGLGNLSEEQIGQILTPLNKFYPVRIGGECRICFIEKVNIADLPDKESIIRRVALNGKFRVILTSPAYFPKNGFYPDFLNISDNCFPVGNWEVAGDGKTVQLVSVVTGRCARIGGWDLANKRPKEMVKMVPAGSVYFFEIKDYNVERDIVWIRKLIEHALPGYIPGGDVKYIKQGFNSILIGGWDYVS